MEDSNVRDDFEWFAHNQSDNTKIYGIILSDNFLMKLFKLLVSYFMNPLFDASKIPSLPRLSLQRPWVWWPLLVLWCQLNPKHVTRLYEQDSRSQNRPRDWVGDGGGVDESIYFLKKNLGPLVYKQVRKFLVEWVECFYFFLSFREMTEMTLKCAQIQQLVTAWHWQSSIND